MSNVTINQLPTANTIDATQDYLPIYTNSSVATQRITRNVYLGLASAPVGLTDSQTLTNKILTSPTINAGTLSGSFSGTYTLGGTPTITAPTIASFANANHTHQNSAGGGTLGEDALSLSDVTTDDVSTTKHGFTPKAPNDTTKFLRGDASWALSTYVIGTGINFSSPTDATTVYSAYGGAFTSGANGGQIPMPIAAIITSVYLSINTTGTVGTSETSTIYINKNASTDTVISSAVVTSSGVTIYNATGLSISLAAGDTWRLKWVTPTWVTNPGQVLIQAGIRFN